MKSTMLRRLFAIILTISLVSCVKNPEDTTVHVTDVTLNPTSLELNPGDVEVLTATVSPSNATNKTVLWITGNAKVATVSDGTVTAVGEGETTITAKSDDGGFTANCIVKVAPAAVLVSRVILSEDNVAIARGTTHKLDAAITPNDASNSDIIWSSSAPGIASVDDTGNVTAFGAGTATITAKSADGNASATCMVTVIVPVEGVTINKTELTLTEGDTETLSANVYPSDATNNKVIWWSNSTSVATVTQNGIVTAVNRGKTPITATTEDGTFVATCIVTVKEKVYAVTGVSLDATTLKMMPGDVQKLVATIAPDNATNKTLIWSSSNASVASVNMGTINALSNGSAVISVTTEDGGFSAKCTVTVTDDITNFVSAKYLGGSMSIINDLIQYGSKLNFSVVNNSRQSIVVDYVQLIDGSTGSVGNKLTINSTINAGSTQSWSITVGLAGIHSPTARFTYTYKGEQYTCEAKYVKW